MVEASTVGNKAKGKELKMAKRKRMSSSLRFDVLHRDGFRCRYCGATQDDGAKLHVDHVVAVKNGGADVLENLVSACATCNLGKSAKVLRPIEPLVPKKTFGLSYLPNGRVHWQFAVHSVSDHAVTIQLFSWWTGEPTKLEVVTREFIENRCQLYSTEEDFWEGGEYWGAIREARVNPKFVVAEKQMANVFD